MKRCSGSTLVTRGTRGRLIRPVTPPAETPARHRQSGNSFASGLCQTRYRSQEIAPTPDQYETDILLWSEHQAELPRRVAAGTRTTDEAPDWPNIIEEIESVGNEQRFAVETLLMQRSYIFGRFRHGRSRVRCLVHQRQENGAAD